MATGRQLTERELAIVNKYSSRHGQVVALDMPIADSDGGIGAPLLRLSTLRRLEERGTISRAEAEAGDRFHELFRLAALDTLHAADMARMPVAAGTVSGALSSSHERCRRWVAEAVGALGGHASIAASATWHIVGLEWSVARWAATARCRNEHACGVLRGALAVLAAHFAGGRRG